MIINERFLHIPPHISTTWSQVASLHMKDQDLIVTMQDSKEIILANLDTETIQIIFDAFAAYLDTDTAPKLAGPKGMPFPSVEGADFPMKMGFSSIDNLGNALQHNPGQAGAPSLPEEILTKIAAVAKIVAPDDPNALPQAEPHCNCIHCQVARAINDGHKQDTITTTIEEIVPDDELQFQDWDIQQTADKVFTVAHRLEPQQKYNVFLGTPVGCTCGEDSCEHIIAVLKS